MKLLHIFQYLWAKGRESHHSLRGLVGREIGIRSGGYPREVIVNLTTIPSRIKRVHLAIESLLRQKLPPNRIILWVGCGVKQGELPWRLSRLQSRGLDIQFREDVGPHTKLWYALQEYPEACHVTADDDHLYPTGWLEAIVTPWLKEPGRVYCGRAKKLPAMNSNGMARYSRWKYAQLGEGPSLGLFPLNYGGTLYSPGSLHSEVFNKQEMLRLAPKADDVWFKCMSLLNGTPVQRVNAEFNDLRSITGTQHISLHKTNVLGDQNTRQFLDTVNAYDLTY